MVGKSIREQRCDDVLAAFSSNNKGCCFLTLTTPDVVDIFEIRRRWRRFRHYLVEYLNIKKGGKDDGWRMKFVMNFELHPNGHGWHIHAVFNCYINLRGGFVSKIRSFGFGSIKIEKVSSVGIAKYLSKHALKAYRGVRGFVRVEGGRLRLVNCSRGLPRLCDYHWSDEFTDQVKKTFARVRRRFPRLWFVTAWRLSELITLECWDWDISLGHYHHRGRDEVVTNWKRLVDSRLCQMAKQGMLLGSRVCW